MASLTSISLHQLGFKLNGNICWRSCQRCRTCQTQQGTTNCLTRSDPGQRYLLWYILTTEVGTNRRQLYPTVHNLNIKNTNHIVGYFTSVGLNTHYLNINYTLTTHYQFTPKDRTNINSLILFSRGGKKWIFRFKFGRRWQEGSDDDDVEKEEEATEEVLRCE